MVFNFDAVLEQFGDFDPYQVVIMVLLGLAEASVSIEQMAVNFLSPSHNFWCASAAPNSNQTSEQQVSMSGISVEDEDYDACLSYHVPWVNDSVLDHAAHNNWTVPSDSNWTKCTTGYEFGATTYVETVTSEWNLVCDKAWIKELISPIYVIGLLVGSVVMGTVADKLGRKVCFLACTILHVLAGVGIYFSPNIWLYIFFRFLIAIAIRGVGSSAAIMLMEMVTPKRRVFALGIYELAYGGGGLILAGVAYAIRDYRSLQLAISLPWVIMIIYWWVLPESPRWLLAKGKWFRATDEIMVMVKRNKRKLPKSMMREIYRLRKQKKSALFGLAQGMANSMSLGAGIGLANPMIQQGKPDVVEELGFWDLFRNPKMRYFSVTAAFSSTTSLLIYIGMSLNIDQLYGNIYFNMMLSSLIEMPPYFGLIVLLNKIGRKPVILMCYLVCVSASLLTSPFLLTDSEMAFMAATILSLLSRAAAGYGVTAQTIFIAELYPTSLRQRALGFANGVAAIVAIAAPFIGGSLRNIWEPLSDIVYGSMAFVTIILCMFLPETLGRPMPNTLKEAINLAENEFESRRKSVVSRMSRRSRRQRDLSDDSRPAAARKWKRESVSAVSATKYPGDEERPASPDIAKPYAHGYMGNDNPAYIHDEKDDVQPSSTTVNENRPVVRFENDAAGSHDKEARKETPAKAQNEVEKELTTPVKDALRGQPYGSPGGTDEGQKDESAPIGSSANDGVTLSVTRL